MKINRILSLALSLCVAGAIPAAGAFAEDKTVTITLLDFGGNVFGTLQGNPGDPVPLDSVDTSVLESHLDDYTQIGFNCWSQVPETFTEDMTVEALYRRMTISLDSIPEKHLYNSKKDLIDLTGLSVTITVLTQKPEIDDNGEFIVDKEVLEITDKCFCKPATAAEAFSEENMGQIKVYPVVEDRPILTYIVNFLADCGDTDSNGSIDASDASNILVYYAAYSTGEPLALSEDILLRYDVDMNGVIDSSDASNTLTYYAVGQTGVSPDWHDILE